MADSLSLNNFSNSQDNGGVTQTGEPQSNVALPAKKPSAKEILTEFGGTGTVMVGGILSSVDYNMDLTGTQRVDIYDQMRKGDATVRAALLAVKLPILSAPWFIQAADESDEAKKIAEFVEDQLMNRMDITWTDWLRHCLNYLDYGSMVFEKIYRLNDDKTIGFEKFAPRLTKTIYRWRMPDNKTEGITQILPTGGIRGIPKWKIMLFVNEQEGDNYEGISILRPAYKSWYMKDALYKIDGIATERQGLGIPYVKIPPNASDQDRASVEELMRNIRANEQANITVPMGWEIGFMDMHATDIKNGKDMILHHDRQITKSVLAQFLELGGTNSAGAKAVADPMMELFLSSELAVTHKIKEVVNSGPIKDLVELNFGVQKKNPTLEHGDITNINLTELAAAVTSFAGAGMLTATPKIEQYLREALKLPEESPEDIEKFKQEKEKKELEKQQALAESGSKGGFGGNKKYTNSEMMAMEDRLLGKFRFAENMTADAIQLKEEIKEVLHGRGIKGY
jgi:hypothetical protein